MVDDVDGIKEGICVLSDCFGKTTISGNIWIIPGKSSKSQIQSSLWDNG